MDDNVLVSWESLDEKKQDIVKKYNPNRRPPKLSDKVAGAIMNALRDGNTIGVAASAGGVSRRTLYYWLERGDKARDLISAGEEDQLNPWDEMYIIFLEAIEEAQAAIQQELMQRINAAGVKSWQANAWILERRWPDDYSLRQKVEHEVKGDRQIEVTFKIQSNAPMLNGETDEPLKIESIEDAEFELLPEGDESDDDD